MNLWRKYKYFTKIYITVTSVPGPAVCRTKLSHTLILNSNLYMFVFFYNIEEDTRENFMRPENSFGKMALHIDGIWNSYIHLNNSVYICKSGKVKMEWKKKEHGAYFSKFSNCGSLNVNMHVAWW